MDYDIFLKRAKTMPRYSVVHFLTIVLGIVSGSFVFYSIYYFEIRPEYLCKSYGVWRRCEQTDICWKGLLIPGMEFKVDTTNRMPSGWIEQYSLHCKTEAEIGLIGSCFFLGCFGGSFILPRAADIIGRKPLFCLGLILNMIALVGLYFGRSEVTLFLSLVLGGIGETGRYYVAYIYAVEILPNS